MRMKSIVRMTACAAAAAVLLGVPAWAADGIVLVQKFTYADKPPQTHQIQIDQTHMRTESTGPDGSKAVIIFDSARQVMTMVSDANKSYSEMSKADMEAAAAQLSGAMSQMQEMMKNLPPERRAQMEAMMKGRGAAPGAAAPAAAPARPVFHKVGTATVGKWTCDKYEGLTNGQKTHEVCTVDPKVLGFSPADFQVTRDMIAFFKQFQGQLPQLQQQSQSQTFTMGTVEDQGFSGIPVRSVSTSNGSQVTFEIADVHREAFTDATFQPPAGYQKIDLFGGRGRRGR
jgi:hypothetical protein